MTSNYSPDEFDYALLRAIKSIGDHYPKTDHNWLIPQQEGWVTSARVREEVKANSLPTRRALKHLWVEGYVDSQKYEQVEFYRLSSLGGALLAEGARGLDLPQVVDSSTWTGVVEPVQVIRVLQIVSQIEDVAEELRDNSERAQVMGLVTALKVLLDLPNPPRTGIMDLVRDSAFANIIQIGTFLAAIVAALRA